MVTDAERLAEIVRFSPGACLVLEEGEVRGANAEAIDVTGIPRKRLVGVALHELAIDEHQESTKAAIAAASSTVTTHRLRLSGGLRPIELSIRLVAGRISLVMVRSLAFEHELSAKAGGSLTHDAVTSLPDRYHVLEQLQHRLTVVPAQPLALIGLWIDDLDTLVNEQGQRVVDRINRQVGERVQARLRGPDLLGRFDSAGFLVLLNTDSEMEQLKEIADRLRSEVSFPVEFDGSLVSFTSSVMVASIGKKRPSIERILARLQMVSEKAAGGAGNRTDIFSL